MFALLRSGTRRPTSSQVRYSSMRRLLRPLLVLVALVVATLGMTGTAAAAPTGGNAPAAKACQKGGYTSLARAESPTVAFTSSEECTAYAAKGGTLVPLQTVNLDAFRDACQAVGGDYSGPYVEGDSVFFSCSIGFVPVEDQEATLQAACDEMNGTFRFLLVIRKFYSECGGIPVPS